MITPNYLWQVGLISDGTATVTGVVIYSTGETRRVSLSITTTAHNVKYWLENASGGSKWLPTAWALAILEVSGANLHFNAGSATETDGDWTQAPTTSDMKIVAGVYYESPVVIGTRAYGGSVGRPASSPPSVIGYNDAETVETTVLRAGGATGWLGASTYGSKPRVGRLTNIGATTVYVAYVAVGASLTGAVSALAYNASIAAGASIEMYIPAGYDLAVVRASGSDDVRYLEMI